MVISIGMTIRSICRNVNLDDRDQSQDCCVHLFIVEQDLKFYGMEVTWFQEKVNGEQHNEAFFILFDKNLVKNSMSNLAPYYEQLKTGIHAASEESVDNVENSMHPLSRECIFNLIPDYVIIRRLLDFGL